MSEVKELIRVGVVSSVDEGRHTVRVLFEDKDNMVSYDLPIIVPHTLKMRDYRMPDIGEQVVCLFMGNGIEEGYCLGAIYSDEDLPPIKDKNLRGTWFEDGSYAFFDRTTGTLNVKAVGDVKIEGNLIVSGTITQGGAP